MAFQDIIDKLKKAYNSLKEAIEFKTDYDKLIALLPDIDKQKDYYYDAVKNEWVLKSQMGTPLQRLDQIVDNLEKSVVPNTITVESAQTVYIPIGNVDILYNQVQLKLLTHTYPEVELDFNLTTEVIDENFVDKSFYVLRDYIYFHNDKAEYTFTFRPSYNLVMEFHNSAQYSVRIEYYFSYSDNIDLNEMDVNPVGHRFTTATYKTYEIYRPEKKFNRLTLMLKDASNINFTIEIYMMYTPTFTFLYETDTINIAQTSYTKTYDFPMCNHIYLKIINNKVSTLYTNLNLFFSNSLLESMIELANLGEKDHASLTNVLSSQHHSKTVSSEIDHDQTQNFEANEHIDWSAGSAGTIHTDNYIEGGAGTDTTAIHDNESGEINGITEKTTPHDDDLLIIEDSEASNVKKKLKMSNLPAGSVSVGDGLPDSSNQAWIQLDFETDRYADIQGYAYKYCNLTGQDEEMLFGIPLPRTIGSKSLYIDGCKVGVNLADASNYVNQVILENVKYNGMASWWSDGTNLTSSQLKTYTFTAIDCSGAEGLRICIKTVVATTRYLRLSSVWVRYYYE